MVQRRKEHVEAGMVAAATTLFAEVGYEATTVALVAERAGTSVGNVYKYFPSKEALFAAAVPEAFARELSQMTRERIQALGTTLDVDSLAPGTRYHVLSGQLIDYCIENREHVVILFGRAHGTPFEPFAEGFVNDLIEWALEYVSGAYPAVVVTAALRFALHEIYRNYVSAITTALAKGRSPEQIREALDNLTAYHQGGLKRLFETAARATPKSKIQRRRTR